jgi:hypothetical protein
MGLLFFKGCGNPKSGKVQGTKVRICPFLGVDSGVKLEYDALSMQGDCAQTTALWVYSKWWSR